MLIQVTGNYQIKINENVVIATTLNTSNAIVTLPTAVLVKGAIFIIKKQGGSRDVVVSCLLGQLIDGAPTDVIGAVNRSRMYVSDGANWISIILN